MLNIAPEEILNTEFYLNNIFAINLVPKIRYINQTFRKLNGFIYLIEGEINFSYKNTDITVHPGGLIYLPHSSCHIYRAVSKNVRYIRVDFDMYCVKSSEMIIFSNRPTLLTEKLDKNIVKLLFELADLYSNPKYAYTLNSLSLTYKFLYSILKLEHYKSMTNSKETKAEQCMEYINEHCCSNVTIEMLCKRFNVSPTHLRRIFKKASGLTIVDFINKRRIEASVALLEKTDMQIVDIAYTVGYESQNYYTRVFKKLMDITPNEYRKLFRKY